MDDIDTLVLENRALRYQVTQQAELLKTQRLELAVLRRLQRLVHRASELVTPAVARVLGS